MTTPPPQPAGDSRTTRARRLFRRVVLGGLLLVLVGGGLYLTVAMNWSYSAGDRAGYVQKFSKKGWVCKTWEGELAMANLPGAMPEVFHFTVRDDAVAEKINAQLGSRVAISYEQHLGLPSCLGETSYWVQSVRKVDP